MYGLTLNAYSVTIISLTDKITRLHHVKRRLLRDMYAESQYLNLHTLVLTFCIHIYPSFRYHRIRRLYVWMVKADAQTDLPFPCSGFMMKCSYRRRRWIYSCVSASGNRFFIVCNKSHKEINTCLSNMIKNTWSIPGSFFFLCSFKPVLISFSSADWLNVSWEKNALWLNNLCNTIHL